jgi:hypothetical protein
MKQSTLHSLITAKTILDEASPLILSGNIYSSSAGLILLQDSLELVVLSLLCELGVDEKVNLERKSFDELVAELRKTGTPVPKTGTIKAMNKQRVITKHYGQLAQPDTVINYYHATKMMIDSSVKHVLGMPIDEIMLTELLEDGEAKEFLECAIKFKDEGSYLECLIETRKAIYVEYEYEYAIHGWVDAPPGEPMGLSFFGRGGLKAPYHTRSKEWIEEHVKTPVDYVQVNHEQIRNDALEWGVNTSTFDNLRRLTPQVFRKNNTSNWCVDYELNFPANEANEANCNYCLDTTINLLLKKKEHVQLRRWPKRDKSSEIPPIYIDHSVYKLARTDSEVVHLVKEGYEYRINKYVSGFSDGEDFLYVTGNLPADDENKYGSDFISGYLLKTEG